LPVQAQTPKGTGRKKEKIISPVIKSLRVFQRKKVFVMEENETIAALSTGKGNAALAIIRISGIKHLKF